MHFIMLNSWVWLAAQNCQKKKKKKKSTKKSKPQSSWTLKIAEVQEVACVLQLS